MVLDTLSERQRILNTGTTLGYKTIFLEFTDKGKEDAENYLEDENRTLLLYSLL